MPHLTEPNTCFALFGSKVPMRHAMTRSKYRDRKGWMARIIVAVPRAQKWPKPCYSIHAYSARMTAMYKPVCHGESRRLQCVSRVGWQIGCMLCVRPCMHPS